MFLYIKSSVIIGTLLLSAFSLPTASSEQKQIVNMAKDKLIWQITPEGAAFATLKGERFKEAYMAMVKLPAGTVSPMHVKSANMFGVVIKGTFSHIAHGALPSTEVALPAGSYYMIPAGLAHISKCISKTACVSYLYQDGKFDFVPVMDKQMPKNDRTL